MQLSLIINFNNAFFFHIMKGAFPGVVAVLLAAMMIGTFLFAFVIPRVCRAVVTAVTFSAESIVKTVKEIASFSASPVPDYAPLPDSGQKAARIFDSLDTNQTGWLTIDKLDILVPQLGWGWRCDDRIRNELQFIDVTRTPLVFRSDFIKWYLLVLEMQEHEQKARDAFRTQANGTAAMINLRMLSRVFDILDIKHAKKKALRIAIRISSRSYGRRRVIYESDFVEWYIGWRFGNDDDDSVDDLGYKNDADYGIINPFTAPPIPAAASPTMQFLRGWYGGIGKVTSKSWKCPNCWIQNDIECRHCCACGCFRPSSTKEEQEDDDTVSVSTLSTAYYFAHFTIPGLANLQIATGYGGNDWEYLDADDEDDDSWASSVETCPVACPPCFSSSSCTALVPYVSRALVVAPCREVVPYATRTLARCYDRPSVPHLPAPKEQVVHHHHHHHYYIRPSDVMFEFHGILDCKIDVVDHLHGYDDCRLDCSTSTVFSYVA